MQTKVPQVIMFEVFWEMVAKLSTLLELLAVIVKFNISPKPHKKENISTEKYVTILLLSYNNLQFKIKKIIRQIIISLSVFKNMCLEKNEAIDIFICLAISFKWMH